MRYLFCFCLYFIFLSVNANTYSDDVKKLLIQLDSLIAKSESFVKIKEARIDQLHKMQNINSNIDEERYWKNKMLYDEYCVYNSDSAMYYVEQNIALAKSLSSKDRVVEWKIKKSFLLAATGLLTEAQKEVEGIYGSNLPQNLKIDYYGQMIYLYSHFGQYSADDFVSAREGYYSKAAIYKDSIYSTITPDNPQYLWFKGWKYLGAKQDDNVIDELQKAVDKSHLDNRIDAMNAYILARLYRDKKDEDLYLKMLIYSAMADVKTSNKDIASLQELSQALFGFGDIDHAYVYINYCMKNSLLYRNRIRVLGISKVQDDIHKAFQARNERQEDNLHIYLVVVSIMSVILAFAIIYIYSQMKHLSNSRIKLNDVNQLLNRHVKDLSQAHSQMSEMNICLKNLNNELKNTNSKLLELNYVKEEYIGYVFALCSNYISKLDEFRKTINRKIRAKQHDEIRIMTDTPTMVQNELKEFYNSFDAIFLRVYHNFVSDFNALLKDDEQIVLKDGELLNTELRIYALERLGITDSIKIANFLHCSQQTVYNNRLKTRNRSKMSKEEFVEAIKNIGNMQE